MVEARLPLPNMTGSMIRVVRVLQEEPVGALPLRGLAGRTKTSVSTACCVVEEMRRLRRVERLRFALRKGPTDPRFGYVLTGRGLREADALLGRPDSADAHGLRTVGMVR